MFNVFDRSTINNVTVSLRPRYACVGSSRHVTGKLSSNEINNRFVIQKVITACDHSDGAYGVRSAGYRHRQIR